MSKFTFVSAICAFLIVSVSAIPVNAASDSISIGCATNGSFGKRNEINGLKVEAICNEDGYISELVFSGKIPAGLIEWGNPVQTDGEAFYIPLTRRIKAKPGMLWGVNLVIPPK